MPFSQNNEPEVVLLNPEIGATLTPSELQFTDAITVEAWINVDEARGEAWQEIVSQWTPSTNLTVFDAYDAGQTDGLDTTGFFGAVFDSRYIYFVPQHDKVTRHGKVLRYDTHGAFHEPASWTGYDAGNTDGLNTKGFYGAVYDGRYVYFVPRRDADDFHSRVLRYDTKIEFTNPAAWQAYDAGLKRSYQSAAFDGRYIYFCPGHVAVPKESVEEAPDCSSPAVTGMSSNFYLAGNSVVLRYDTQGEFKSSASWVAHDVANTDGLCTNDYDGGAFDGRYIYFVPLSTGIVLRYDTQSDFKDGASWSTFDAKPLGLLQCVGGVFDGRHLYFVPYGESEIAVRYDTHCPFAERASWSTYCVTQTTGLPAIGWDGGAFDGRHVYFIPYYDGVKVFHGYLLRYDTTGDFGSPSSWLAVDTGNAGGLQTIGFNAGAYDGRYLYYAPWNDGSLFPAALLGHGRVLRYDTIGENGTFSLRFVDYGHNGGLCAAVPGTRFLVNTEQGVRSVAANRAPVSGRHYIVGVYDGRIIQLYIDGALVNEQPATGRLVQSDVDISAGKVLNGLGRFQGRIEEVRISACARDAAWIERRFSGEA